MNASERQAIRERARNVERARNGPYTPGEWREFVRASQRDVPALLDEVARLTAVVERVEWLADHWAQAPILADVTMELRAALDPAPLHGGVTADLPGQTP